MPPSYVGRFAPSPSGPLHFGSLVAAAGSYLEARCAGGRWLLRIEDVDRPRTVAGAEAQILRQLEALGFEWELDPWRQSERDQAYRAALASLRECAQVFDCGCSRREIADSALAPDGAPRYPGTCRNGLAAGRQARTVRLRTEAGVEICFDDAVQGRVCEDVGTAVGDFVLQRADGLFAYQLAVVVDDAASGVTDVVRGADLIDSTCRQIWLQRCLGLPTPRYMHLPVAINGYGNKLSKQSRARAIDPSRPAPALVAALAFLGQQPPDALAGGSPATIWRWAIDHWRPEAIPPRRSIRADAEFWEEDA
ncbi:MAG: tRNA glutamyl-Q(34) synthetase GluQRS [Rhodocyclaceae bacterium]|nr:tRNA glutamyl-Q(34) synthetase GluQRS [Rhodocyclaceae bacterium]